MRVTLTNELCLNMQVYIAISRVKADREASRNERYMQPRAEVKTAQSHQSES